MQNSEKRRADRKKSGAIYADNQTMCDMVVELHALRVWTSQT